MAQLKQHTPVEEVLELLNQQGSDSLRDAFGIDPQGKRHIFAMSAERSDAEVHWHNFLQNLVGRAPRAICR